MISSLISSIGLVLDIVGASLVCFYGFPQREYSEISETSIPLLVDIKIPGAKEHNELMRKRKTRHLWVARFSLVFMIVGFILQLVSNWF